MMTDFDAIADYDLFAGNQPADPDDAEPRFLRLLGEAVARHAADSYQAVPIEVVSHDGHLLGGNATWTAHYQAYGQAWTVRLRAAEDAITVTALGGPRVDGGGLVLPPKPLPQAFAVRYPPQGAAALVSAPYGDQLHQAINRVVEALGAARASATPSTL